MKKYKFILDDGEEIIHELTDLQRRVFGEGKLGWNCNGLSSSDCRGCKFLKHGEDCVGIKKFSVVDLVAIEEIKEEDQSDKRFFDNDWKEAPSDFMYIDENGAVCLKCWNLHKNRVAAAEEIIIMYKPKAKKKYEIECTEGEYEKVKEIIGVK